MWGSANHAELAEIRRSMAVIRELLERNDKQMSQLSDSVASVSASEAAMEQRVNVLIQKQHDVAVAMQKQIDALTAADANDADMQAAVKELAAIKASLDAFNAAPVVPVVPVIPPVVPVVEPTPVNAPGTPLEPVSATPAPEAPVIPESHPMNGVIEPGLGGPVA